MTFSAPVSPIKPPGIGGGEIYRRNIQTSPFPSREVTPMPPAARNYGHIIPKLGIGAAVTAGLGGIGYLAKNIINKHYAQQKHFPKIINATNIYR